MHWSLFITITLQAKLGILQDCSER